MRIIYLSDIHIDHSIYNKELLLNIIDNISRMKPDVIIIAGDVANTVDKFDYCLSLFKSYDCRKLLIPGNHDIWIENNFISNSYIKYKYILPYIANKNGFEYLPEKKVLIDGVCFVGTLGWYDYSFKRKSLKYSDADYERGKLGSYKNMDSEYIEWIVSKPLSNKEIAESLHHTFLSDMNSINSDINKVVIVTHTVPFIECLSVYDEVPDNPMIAYEGSKHLGTAICEVLRDREVYVIHGHCHDNVIKDEINGIRVYSKPIGEIYHRANNPEKFIGVLDL